MACALFVQVQVCANYYRLGQAEVVIQGQPGEGVVYLLLFIVHLGQPGVGLVSFRKNFLHTLKEGKIFANFGGGKARNGDL